MDSTNNVTLRKPISRTKSLETIDMSISMNSSQSEEFLGKSLDLSTHVLALCREEMKDEINNLKVCLQSTQNELDNVILENSDLKKQIAHLSQEIGVLKQICKSPLSSLRKVQPQNRKSNAKRRLTDCFDNPTPPILDVVQAPQRVTTSPLPHSETTTEKSAEKKSSHCNNTPVYQQPNNITKTTTPTSKKQTLNKRAFIFGGQGCAGLATKLIKSRFRTRYSEYKFLSVIKPNATTEEILCSSKLYDICKDDRLILFIGQNDCNPFIIEAELCAFLKTVTCQVFLVRVFKNKYLNESKLNSLLQYISKQYTHCTYVDIDYSNSYNYMTTVCNKINSVLDQVDYNESFLIQPCKSIYRYGADWHKIHYNNFRSNTTPSKQLTLKRDQCTQTDTDLVEMKGSVPNDNMLFRE